ncbi:hypothetical protein [Shewanella zhangzhouensis]|uniref:hypothetical protein n=1 Tax=Shewanella zhangzhouensis TaxID=2864213 RepID=UPI001C655FEA|nr:hypothetical protein [Shewanella zhangzhouensis]QYK06788.1 hypothetical protein K0H63_08275 [Shewanella zhangzhouensis]
MNKPVLRPLSLAAAVTAALCFTAIAAPSSIPDVPETAALAKAPEVVHHRVEIKKSHPDQVFVSVMKDGDETSFTLKGDELKDEALIDNKLAALDDDTRADIIKTLKSLNDGKIRVIDNEGRERLKTLTLALKSREHEMTARSHALTEMGDDIAKMGEEIEALVMSSVQQIELDGDGHRTIVLHQAAGDENAVELRHFSVDEGAMRFKMLKDLLEDAELSQPQKDELKALLTN